MSTGYVFNCFRNVELTTNIEDGDETILRNECGKKCFQTRKPDELTNIGLAFELLNPDYELTALLTGQPLINDGLENIGWFQREGQTHSPWVCVELFEQVPDENCAVGHRYRRLVIPKIRFKLPSNTREDPFRVIPFEGVSSARSVAGYGEGPYHDSPFDFSGIGSAVETHYMEFFDDTIEGTLEGNCGFLTVTCGEQFMARWTGQNELTVTADEGETIFCDADEIVIELEGGGLINIPLPDPCVEVVDCETIIITCWDTYNPDNEVIAGITARLDGEPLGGYDGTSGLPDGELAEIPASPDFIEELFPGIGTGDGHIQMGGNAGPGCWYLTMWYNCSTDRLAIGFNRKDLYGVPHTVFRTEIETDNGVFSDVPVVDEWKTGAGAWTYGSGMTIEDAAALYGTHWKHIRVYDNADVLICEFDEPQQTWNGGPWRLNQNRCVDDTPPVPPATFPNINSVVVNP